jgi:serine/threonine protein phosphatase PrpC
MEDALVIEEDLGGSEWKLMSAFCVIDGHGGSEAAEFIKQNLKGKLQGWSKMLDSVADIN